MPLQTNVAANFLRRFTGERKARQGNDGKEVCLVNLTTLPIGPAELKTAFAVSENILWYRALMQTLEVRRQECSDAAGAAVRENNSLKTAGFSYAAVVLGEVIVDLQKLRQKSVSE